MKGFVETSHCGVSNTTLRNKGPKHINMETAVITPTIIPRDGMFQKKSTI